MIPRNLEIIPAAECDHLYSAYCAVFGSEHRTPRCDTLVGDLQVLAGTWTRINELFAICTHNAPRLSFTPAQVTTTQIKNVKNVTPEERQILLKYTLQHT